MGKINVFHAFSGVDSQYMAEKRVWGDRVNLLGTIEVDADAIISCAAVHENEKFVKFLEKDFTPEQYEQTKEWLKGRNIGFDFEKGKSKIDRMKKEKLRQLFIASRLTKNLGDISLANQTKMSEEVDIFTYSSPCTSFSLAGNQEGLSGASGLLLECEKFIEVNRPKVLLLENVKNLVQKKFKPDFDNWCNTLEKLGYKNYWKVINAKNMGIPQNRDRVFLVSVRKDVDCGYEFPEGFPLEIRLKDMLDKEIDPKYYLSDEIVARFKAKMPSLNSDIQIVGSTAPEFRKIGQRDECYSTEGVMGCLTATDYKQPKQIAIPEPTICEQRSDEGLRYFKDNICGTLRTIDACGDKRVIEPTVINPLKSQTEYRWHFDQQVYDSNGIARAVKAGGGSGNIPKVIENPEPLLIKEATKKGYAEAYDGDSVNLEQPNSQTRRGRVGDQIANTLMTSCAQGVVEGYRIRKLTPSECWKLMNFDEGSFEKATPYISDSAAYKIAGNSIVVSCLEYIFRNLDIDKIKGGTICNIKSQSISTNTKENIG